jgi:translation initiation factor 2-alpha kinase 4
VSETDEETTSTEVATTDNSVSEMSPGTGPNVEFGVSTGGLDFMSSSGYPQIEFGYDDASDKDEVSDEEDENSTNPDDQDANGGEGRNNLVSYSPFLTRRCFFL